MTSGQINPAIGVVGYGRFGRFWAQVLAADFPVVATDRAPAGTQPDNIPLVTMAELCTQANVIFLCVPINQLSAVVADLLPLVRPGTIIMDTCSVKVVPAEILETAFAGREEVTVLCAHPMFGPDSAGESVAGHALVLWPLLRAEKAFRQWQDYFTRKQMRVVKMSPEEHDRTAAFSQGVTHYLGRVLGAMHLQPTPIATDGYNRLLSIIQHTVNDSWELFCDLQHYNPYTPEMRLRLETVMNQIYGRLLAARPEPAVWRVGIQGGKGSFNEEACRAYCSQNEITAYEIDYLYTSRNVLQALHKGEIERGVFAIQNAVGGVVMETIQALSEFDCEIVAVFDIVISHCLLVQPEVAFADVDTIISHPQALAQCRSTLQTLYPHLRQISGEGDLVDQALCAQHLAEGKLPPNYAVLAPNVCADLYQLSTYDRNLQDLGAKNLTTFVWVKRRDYLPV
jgi:prephenate dehydrogenase